jgi:hypothetical protein
MEADQGDLHARDLSSRDRLAQLIWHQSDCTVKPIVLKRDQAPAIHPASLPFPALVRCLTIPLLACSFG